MEGLFLRGSSPTTPRGGRRFLPSSLPSPYSLLCLLRLQATANLKETLVLGVAPPHKRALGQARLELFLAVEAARLRVVQLLQAASRLLLAVFTEVLAQVLLGPQLGNAASAAAGCLRGEGRDKAAAGRLQGGMAAQQCPGLEGWLRAENYTLSGKAAEPYR